LRGGTTPRGHPHGRTFAVTLDGRPYHVDAARIDAQTLSLVVDTVSRQSYEATVIPDP
jgi:hypothetical protein